MSMVACAVCGGTIDCSGWDWYACRKCGAPIHTDCDKDWKPGDEFICPECREKEYISESDWKPLASEIPKELKELITEELNNESEAKS